MGLALGVDTGGTYTDVVLVRDEVEVVASAKALTTRQDLAIGIGSAVEAVLSQSGTKPAGIGLASLSTTLATNALVEGQGGRVALVYVGFDESDLERHGLADALAGDPVACIGGGHTHSGTEAAALDLEALDTFLETTAADVSAFAVASLFSTRNPSHEQLVAERIRQRSQKPVTCSYQLSAKLNGPKRAVTAVLNARLIGMIDALIGRAEDTLRRLGVEAPMMVVRGDGALMSGAEARRRPIETILSGPAASIVGASWLTGAQDAIVSDIGGTTTDVALIRDGKPALDSQGARVGQHRTMVEAVAMRTTGLGGDSQVHVKASGLTGGVVLGPKRVVPVSLMAMDAPDTVHRALDLAMSAPLVTELDGRFVRRIKGVPTSGLALRDQALLDRLSEGVEPLSAVLKTRMEHGALNRLWERGVVQLAGVTPTDASHVLGQQASWDVAAAEKALTLLAKRRIGTGEPLAKDAVHLAQMIVDQLTTQTVSALLETVFSEDPGFDTPAENLVDHPLIQRALAGHRGLIALDAAINVDVVGLGASAATYYPAVGDRLNLPVLLPEHAEVANAIGAVVGRLSERLQGHVTAPSEGLFRVHFESGPQDFRSKEEALSVLEQTLSEHARQTIERAGAVDVTVTTARDIRSTQVENREVFVEAEISVEATGRPRIAA
ncbi:hydantoinase/oxoprolinase family protein [Epibacterium ulvae]|uniref:hydantoinase/oxoprolinase N-terminal domain-containing protein n=1 Tax=Epibacterium ulvae TaxID=1156985 RepID=UPI001BFC2636|nr:hydantoinase/oxoprolinase family protein [Epibacterium ulvae]MBT8155864.1 hydantoinase/oxoprolinase family protein [Epibacterium ulvae]